MAETDFGYLEDSNAHNNWLYLTGMADFISAFYSNLSSMTMISLEKLRKRVFRYFERIQIRLKTRFHNFSSKIIVIELKLE